jgi:diguanylate cyclase (GGDEF)-like protein
MKSINGFQACLLSGIAALVLPACANHREPARVALVQISNMSVSTSADGAKYVPVQMATVQKEHAELQDSFDKRNYAAVLTGAPAVLADTKSLAVAATAKKGEIAKTLDTQWSKFAWFLPQRIASAQEVKAKIESAASLDADPEAVHIAALQRELAFTSERLKYRRRELRWTVAIIALAGIVVALLVWMLRVNLRHRRELLRLAEQDSLTGLPNRRCAAERASAALASSAVSSRPVTIALIDLDHFKSINDRCGHAVGDRVLQEFTRRARDVLRATDMLGRWGGEEFLLVLPDTDIERAVTTIHRIRAAMTDFQLPETGRGLRVSFSAGLATRTTSAQSPDEVIASADAALYEAKNGGRNLVRLDHETFRAAASEILRTLYDRV